MKIERKANKIKKLRVKVSPFKNKNILKIFKIKNILKTFKINTQKTRQNCTWS